MHKLCILCLVLTSLGFTYGADAVRVTGEIDGKRLSLPAELENRLVALSLSLLANCTNTVVQPIGTLANAQRQSHLHFIFTEPHIVDLGKKQSALTTGVQVKEMVITLPLSSGGAWIDSTKFRWYCSKFNSTLTEEMDKVLKSVQKP